MKKFVIIVGLLALALGGGWWWKTSRGQTLTESAVTFAPFTRGDMRDLVSATGVLETRDHVVIGSELPGVIHSFAHKVNDSVVEGDILATLDDRAARLKFEQAENGVLVAKGAVAQAEAAKAAAELALKYQSEIEKKGGFRSERDQAEAQVKAASAGLLIADAKLKSADTMLKEAQLALDLTRIRVPTRSPDGQRREYLIVERKGAAGQTTGPQAGPIFFLAGDLANMEVHTQVAEGDVNRVRKGLPAIFALPTYSGEDVEFRGIVREIRPTPSRLGGGVFYDTVIEVANQKDPATGEWRLRPGMTASVDIIRRERKNVWKVPSKALELRMDEAYFTPAVRIRLAEWKSRPDAEQWTTLWTWDAGHGSIWPVFVRIYGPGAEGETGLKDAEGNEVLEFERDFGDHPPRLIIVAPPARAPGMFEQPANFKVS